MCAQASTPTFPADFIILSWILQNDIHCTLYMSLFWRFRKAFPEMMQNSYCTYSSLIFIIAYTQKWGKKKKIKKLFRHGSYKKIQMFELRTRVSQNTKLFCFFKFCFSFFTEQNNRIFQTLLDVASSQDRTLTSEHMRNMGLDPVGDRVFLMELVETYGIDVMLMVDNPCCPK